MINLLNGMPAAVARARSLDETGEPKIVTAPAAAEVLVGAYYLGGKEIGKAQELLDCLTLIEFDREAFHEAGRIGANLLAQGESMGAADIRDRRGGPRSVRGFLCAGLIPEADIRNRIRGILFEPSNQSRSLPHGLWVLRGGERWRLTFLDTS